MSLIVTAIIVTILLYPAPVYAVSVSITGLNGANVQQGATKTFYINLVLETSEFIPVQNVKITVTGPTSFTETFSATAGGTGTYITLVAPAFLNYGQDNYYGYGYGYFPGDGYGYGYYPAGYGYGYYGATTMTWQATFTNTLTMSTGTYHVTAEVESDGVWWGGGPTEVTFTITAVPPVDKPDLTAQFVNLPTEFQVTREYDILVRVRNTGLANASTFNITLTAGGTLIGKFNVAGLASGANTTLLFKWTPPATGSYSLVATADSDANVAETSETNNTATTTVVVGAYVPTPAEIEAMTDAEAAQALEGLPAIQAAGILEQVSLDKCAHVLLAMDATKAADVLLAMNPATAAGIVEAMVDIDASGTAIVIEEAAAINVNATVAILEEMDSEHLATLILAIINLPSTPQVAAELLEHMSTEKAVEVVKVIFELGAQEDLAKAYTYLSDAKLNVITESLTVEERGSILEYLTPETVDRITPELIAYPDLTPDSIAVDPAEPEAGETVTVTVTVKNIGRADAGAFNVRLEVGGTTVQTLAVEGLAVDGTETLTFTWTPTAQGTYTVTAVVDPENAVTELVETSNELSESVTVLTVPLPDLTAAFTGLPTSFQAGTAYTITVTVQNTGTGNAGQFTVALAASGTSVGTQTVTSLAAGASTTVTFTWTPATAGSYTLTATADSGNAVTESSETNNTATTTVTVAAPPTDYTLYIIIAVAVVIVLALVYVMIRRKK
jgi:flagellar motility protein MotE (MotC chaperone)